MLKADGTLLYLSQSALAGYQLCSLKFKKRYLDGLYWPKIWAADDAQRNALEQGRIFHLLAQRYYMGGNTGSFEPVNQWLARLQQFCPWEHGYQFWPEYELRYHEESLNLLAKFDLVVLTPLGKLLIYDWKTNPRQLQAGKLNTSMQTLVYRYLACLGSEMFTGKLLEPEDICMIYWNPRYPENPVSLAYSQELFQQDDLKIRELIKEIEQCRPEDFAATVEEENCHRCEYMPICHGERAVALEFDEDDWDFEMEWDMVEEIVF